MSDKEQLSSYIRGFQGKRIAVLGDLMLDRYIWGRASRLSQEAPVPVVRVHRETSALGGAANVVRNILSLGGEALAFGVVGSDGHGDELVRGLEAAGADVVGVTALQGRPTTVKTRVIAGTQQVVRIDREDVTLLPAAVANPIAEGLCETIARGVVDAVILEDYAKGVLCKAAITQILSTARAAGIPVSLDPHASNAFMTPGLELMTPNRAEAFALAGKYYQSANGHPLQDRALLAVGQTLLEQWQVRLLLITLGGGGMALFRSDGPPAHIPTQAREVFDVSGAGDTVMAAFSLARLAGASPLSAAAIANAAAGLVVAELGTAVVSADELAGALWSRS